MTYSLLRVSWDTANYYRIPFIVSLWLTWQARRAEIIRVRRASGA